MIKLDKLNIISNNHILINPFKEKWKNVNGTNCYAYALGLDINYDDLSISGFEPGFTANTCLPSCFNGSDLIDNVVKDIDNLKIDYKHVNDYYKLGEGEWKIAIFGGIRNSFNSFDDYHFMRQTIDGVWSHKHGYYSFPSIVDSDGKKIESPKKCRVDAYCINYEYIMTLCLKK